MEMLRGCTQPSSASGRERILCHPRNKLGGQQLRPSLSKGPVLLGVLWDVHHSTKNFHKGRKQDVSDVVWGQKNSCSWDFSW